MRARSSGSSFSSIGFTFMMIASRYRIATMTTTFTSKYERRNVFAVCFFLLFPFFCHMFYHHHHHHKYSQPLILPLSGVGGRTALVCTENICFGYISSAFCCLQDRRWRRRAELVNNDRAEWNSSTSAFSIKR